MTVEQLIEKLREFPPYREVYVGASPLVGVREVQSNMGEWGKQRPVIRVAIW